jgi:transcriptional regulator with XRE-family HTH domain
MPMTPRERFAKNLVEARRGSGLTQEELADRCDLHRTEISLLERGGREPRLGTLVKLSGALGVSVESLAAGIRWDEKAQKFKYRR